MRASLTPFEELIRHNVLNPTLMASRTLGGTHPPWDSVHDRGWRMSEVSTFEVVVINLDRRPDRLSTIETQLSALGLPFTRLSAVDARDLPPETDVRLTSRPQTACWMSHQLCFERLTHSHFEHLFILEDDAVLDPSRDWPRLLASSQHVMTANDVGVLQLGYSSQFDPLQRLPKPVAHWLTERHHAKVPMPEPFLDLHIVQDSFRPGGHAYLIDRRAAGAIAGFNIPVARNADDFFTDLSYSGVVHRKWHVSRLSMSLAGQASRLSKDSVIDSDLG